MEPLWNKCHGQPGVICSDFLTQPLDRRCCRASPLPSDDPELYVAELHIFDPTHTFTFQSASTSSLRMSLFYNKSVATLDTFFSANFHDTLN